MKNSSLLTAFLLCFLAMMLASPLLPNIHLNYFAPLCLLLIRHRSLATALWAAFFCGILIDATSSFLFGLHAISTCFATFFVFRHKKQIFDEKPIHFSLFTAWISVWMTLSQILLLALMEKGLSFTFVDLFSSILLMSLLDGVYGFMWVFCPINGLDWLKNSLRIFFLKRKKLQR